MDKWLLVILVLHMVCIVLLTGAALFQAGINNSVMERLDAQRRWLDALSDIAKRQEEQP